MTKPIGELLQAFFAGKLGTAAPLEARLREAWGRLLGPEVAAVTRRLNLHRGTLRVEISDPLLQTELRFRAAELAEQLRQMGFREVRQVRIS
jgi:hypothetical protein